MSFGESFEDAMAFLLSNAGFKTEKRFPVIVSGEKVGDLDVLAVDPSTNTRVGIECKEQGEPASAMQFNDFIKTLEIAEIKHGIFAARREIAKTIPPLAERECRKGYKLILIDGNAYENLRESISKGETWRVQDFFRERLELGPKTTTIADYRRAIMPHIGRTIRCENVLPLDFPRDIPPSYIEGFYMEPESAILELHPYLVAELRLHREVRLRGIHEYREIVGSEIAVMDGVTGKLLQTNDPLFSILAKNYPDAIKDRSITEDGFVAEKKEPRFGKQEVLYSIRVEMAKRYVKTFSYKTFSGEERQQTIVPSVSDVRLEYADFIYLPTWSLRYVVKQKPYVRRIVAFDGYVLRDDMSTCIVCHTEPTVAICAVCGSTVGQLHRRICAQCHSSLCTTCSKVCLECNRSYCPEHAIGRSCYICRSYLCSDCTVVCAICNMPVCKVHRNECTTCEKAVCESHKITGTYLLRTKNFCSQKCLIEFEQKYQARSTIGKLRMVMKKPKTESV